MAGRAMAQSPEPAASEALQSPAHGQRRSTLGRSLRKDGKARSVPSIPSKFEVTLFEGHRESLGFGSHAMRFNGGPAEQAPGPAAYGLAKSFHEECNDRTSWGIRGTGGFASRSTRFGPRCLMMRPGLGCPGPGAYRPEPVVSLLRDQSDFCRASRSAVFAQPTVEKADPSALVPGPGAYDTVSALDTKQGFPVQAAFRSSSTRLGGGIKQDDIPGPGEYYDAQPWVGPLSGACSASFKVPSRKHFARIHPDLPPASERAREVLGSFAHEVARELSGTTTAFPVPGPGQYEQERDPFRAGGAISAFQPGPKRTDWAPHYVGELPGPGMYDPKKVPLERMTSAVSAFKSATERNKLLFPPAPGPAYYSPKPLPLGRRSFRLKASNKDWV